MNKKFRRPTPSIVTGKKVPAPVRVKLQRVNCDHAIPYPPDGQTREWWQRLKNAFGTASRAFVGASLQQLIAAARLPNSGFCEIAVNATLAFIEGAKPRDEVESALVIQMACTHSAAMAVLNRLGGGHGTDRGVAAMALPIAARLNGGSQIARVEHGRRADQGAVRSIPPVQFKSPCTVSGTHEAWEGRFGRRTASHLASRPSLQHASMQATVGRNNPSKALARVKANNGAADGRRSAGRVNHESSKGRAVPTARRASLDRLPAAIPFVD
jgi:hypothetical protein